MLTVATSAQTGIAVGTRTTATQPGDVVTFNAARRRSSITQLTRVNDDVLAGKKLGEHGGDLVHVGGRLRRSRAGS